MIVLLASKEILLENQHHYFMFRHIFELIEVLNFFFDCPSIRTAVFLCLI